MKATFSTSEITIQIHSQVAALLVTGAWFGALSIIANSLI